MHARDKSKQQLWHPLSCPLLARFLSRLWGSLTTFPDCYSAVVWSQFSIGGGVLLRGELGRLFGAAGPPPLLPPKKIHSKLRSVVSRCSIWSSSASEKREGS